MENRLGDFTLQAPDGQKPHARPLHRTADDFSEELCRSFAHMWCEKSKVARSAVKQRKCVRPDCKAISAIQGPLKAVRKKPSPHKMIFWKGSDIPHRLGAQPRQPVPRTHTRTSPAPWAVGICIDTSAGARRSPCGGPQVPISHPSDATTSSSPKTGPRPSTSQLATA